MKQFHNLTVNVFIKPEEDYDSVYSAFINLFPFNLKDEKIAVQTVMASSFEDRKIKIESVKLDKTRHIVSLLRFVFEKLGLSGVQTLLDQLETRVDDEMCFFFRLDKKKLLEGKFELTDTGDCYHFKCHAACYPRNIETAKNIVSEFLQKELDSLQNYDKKV